MKKYNTKQINNLRTSGQILRETFAEIQKVLKSGISTLEIDAIAEKFIKDNGGDPCFKNYNGYKFTICASVNEESIHGIPRAEKILKEGDIISVDCGVRFPNDKSGMCTDAARTFAVGNCSEEAKNLIEACEQSFHAATRNLKAGDRVKVIGERIEKFIDGRYGIIDNFFGHGIGLNVHEEPLIPNFDVSKMKGRERVAKAAETVLQDGMIICIEPMINCGTKDVRVGKDGWTVVTADGKLAAHYENTLLIRKDGVEIVT